MTRIQAARIYNLAEDSIHDKSISRPVHFCDTMAPVASIKLLDGTAIPWLAWGNGTGHAAKNAVDSGKAALKAGFKHIDTAQVCLYQRWMYSPSLMPCW